MRSPLGFALTGLALAFAVGCHSSESWGVYGSSSSSITADGGNREHAIETITRNGAPFVILVVNGSSGGSSSAGGGRANGEFRRADRSSLAWQCTTAAGQPTAVVAGKTFDLTKGALLLIDARQETPTIQQHAFDSQQVAGQTVRADLERIATQNPEIAAFVDACWGQKPPADAPAEATGPASAAEGGH